MPPATKKGIRPPTYDAFIAANKASPYTQRGEQNSAAKCWQIIEFDDRCNFEKRRKNHEENYQE